MNNKTLLISLINAESEEEVKRIIDKHPILSQERNWKPGKKANRFRKAFGCCRRD